MYSCIYLCIYDSFCSVRRGVRRGRRDEWVETRIRSEIRCRGLRYQWGRSRALSVFPRVSMHAHVYVAHEWNKGNYSVYLFVHVSCASRILRQDPRVRDNAGVCLSDERGVALIFRPLFTSTSLRGCLEIGIRSVEVAPRWD